MLQHDQSFQAYLLEYNAGPDIDKNSPLTDPSVEQLVSAVVTIGIDTQPRFASPPHDTSCPYSQRRFVPACGWKCRPAASDNGAGHGAGCSANCGFEAVMGCQYPAWPPPRPSASSSSAPGVTVMEDPSRSFGPLDLVYDKPWQAAQVGHLRLN